MTCPICNDSGTTPPQPHIAGITVTFSACTCEAGRQFAADIAALHSAQPVIDYLAGATINPSKGKDQ